MLLDALALTVYDAANSLDEDRWFTLGFESTGQLLAVAHTWQAAETSVRVRIISARKATRRERRSYQEEPR